jgi:hypothetical protein
MEPNIKVARAHRALSWLYALLTGLLAFLAYTMRSEPDLAPVLIYLVLFGLVFAAHHVTARGARQGKPWARISSTVLACLMLLGFPVGTIIGVYLLVYTWRPWDAPVAGAVS